MPEKPGSSHLTVIKHKDRKLFLILLTVWFLINLLQAIFMEVMSDESYYALFGKYLAWGFYDHPPMVALLTRLSSILFNGNL